MARPLVWATVLHVAIAIACAMALTVEAPPLLGVHPAVKPLKFAVSIAILLATVALILAALDLDVRVKAAIAWVLAITMIVEIAIILAQAMRATTSHFNTRTPLDATLWSVMGTAITVALVALAALAWLVSTNALRASPLVTLAVRAGTWLMLLTAVSGYAMGGRGQHTVGGADGGTGLAITNWSRDHGDLRIPHFVTMHGLQVLPIAALILDRLPIGGRVRWISLVAIVVAWIGLAVGTLVRAFAGRAWGS